MPALKNHERYHRKSLVVAFHRKRLSKLPLHLCGAGRFPEHVWDVDGRDSTCLYFFCEVWPIQRVKTRCVFGNTPVGKYKGVETDLEMVLDHCSTYSALCPTPGQIGDHFTNLFLIWCSATDLSVANFAGTPQTLTDQVIISSKNIWIE